MDSSRVLPSQQRKDELEKIKQQIVILKTQQPEKSDFKKIIDTIDHKIEHSIKQGNNAKAMVHLYCLKDASQGIVTHASFYSELEVILYRDAKDEKALLTDSREPYRYAEGFAMIGLNFIETTGKLLEREKKLSAQAIKEWKRALSLNYYCMIRSHPHPKNIFMTLFNQVLIKKLQENGIKKPNTKLSDTRYYYNFELPTIHLVTIIPQNTSKDAYYVKIDFFMGGHYSEKIEDEINQLIAYKAKKEISSLPDWFVKEKQWIQDSILENIERIKAGHVIPTQLIYTPFARNVRQVIDLNLTIHDEEWIEIGNAYYAGTLATKAKGREKYASEIYAQLSYLTQGQNKDDDSKPIFVSLINDTPILFSEKKLSKQLDVIENHGERVVFQFPTQGYQVFTLRDEALKLKSDLHHALQEIENQLIEISDPTDFYENEMDKRIKLRMDALKNKLLSDDIKRKLFLIKKSLVICYLLKKWLDKSRFDAENRNLHLAVLYAIFQYYRNHIAIIGCKSAKDRAGVAEQFQSNLNVALDLFFARLSDDTVSLEKVSDQFETFLDSIEWKSMESRLLNASSVIIKSGMPGGSLGAFGILGDWQGGTPESWRQKSIPSLVEKTAKYNKGIPQSNETPFYKSKIFLFLVVVSGICLCLSGFGIFVGAFTVLISSGFSVGAMGAYSAYAVAINTRKEKTDWKKICKIALALSVLVIGVLLTATGFGAIAGLPVLSIVPWVLGGSFGAIGSGVSYFSLKKLFSPPDRKASFNTPIPWYNNKKVWASLGLAIGLLFCLTGFGAPAGVAVLGAAGIAYLMSSLAVTAISVGGLIAVGAVVVGFTEHKKQTKIQSVVRRLCLPLEEKDSVEKEKIMSTSASLYKIFPQDPSKLECKDTVLSDLSPPLRETVKHEESRVLEKDKESSSASHSRSPD